MSSPPTVGHAMRGRRMGLPWAYLPFVASTALFLLAGQPPLPREARETPLRFDAERAMRDLQRLDAVTREYGGRVSGTPGNRAAGDDLVATIAALPSLEVSEQALTGGSRPLRNIFATRAGSSPSVILVAAHYDSAYPYGATIDNAAGVAVALELARGFAGRKPRSTLRFAFFDGEERDNGGSLAYLESLTPAERGRILAVVSLDSVGWRDGSPVLHTILYRDRSGQARIAPDWLVGTFLRAARARGLALALGDTRLPLLYQLLARSAHTGLHSDDRPFAQAGVPAFFLASFSFTNFCPYYHEPTDTLDKVSREQIGATGTIAEAGVLGLDALERTPPYRSGYLFLGTRRLTVTAMLVLSLLAGLPIWWRLAARGREGHGVFRIGAGLLAAGFPAGVAAGPPEIVFVLFVLPVLFVPVVSVTAGPWVRLAGVLVTAPAGVFVAAALAVLVLRHWAIALPAWQVALLAALLVVCLACLGATRPETDPEHGCSAPPSWEV